MSLSDQAILLIHCNDRKGLIHTVAQFVFEHKGNIVALDEHVEKSEGIFFMRVAWELQGFDIPREEIHSTFHQEIAQHYEMQWQLHFTKKKPRMAIFVSKASHCLYDILSRHYSCEWKIEIPVIFSNHPMHEEVANRYQIPFHYFDMKKESKADIENKQVQLLKDLSVDFIILARYMQILSNDFIQEFQNKIINIHHSFLPAFAGAKPYHRAYERGVKIIGATAHYVTADLDEGPILEQDVVKISHKDNVEDLVRKGKDLEKIVLSRAIRLHLERKALVYQNKTVIFD